MHNRDKYPAIWAEKEAAEKELAALRDKRKVHTDAISALNADKSLTVGFVEAEQQRLNDLAMADYPRIKELTEIVARCAIAMGAVTTSRGK